MYLEILCQLRNHTVFQSCVQDTLYGMLNSQNHTGFWGYLSWLLILAYMALTNSGLFRKWSVIIKNLSHGVAKSRTQLSNWTTEKCISKTYKNNMEKWVYITSTNKPSILMILVWKKNVKVNRHLFKKKKTLEYKVANLNWPVCLWITWTIIHWSLELLITQDNP